MSCICKSQQCGIRGKGIPHGQASLAYLVHSRPERSSISKKDLIKWTTSEEYHSGFSSGLHMHTGVHAHMYLHAYTSISRKWNERKPGAEVGDVDAEGEPWSFWHLSHPHDRAPMQEGQKHRETPLKYWDDKFLQVHDLETCNAAVHTIAPLRIHGVCLEDNLEIWKNQDKRSVSIKDLDGLNPRYIMPAWKAFSINRRMTPYCLTPRSFGLF